MHWKCDKYTLHVFRWHIAYWGYCWNIVQVYRQVPDTYAKSFQEITCMVIREQITCQENKTKWGFFFKYTSNILKLDISYFLLYKLPNICLPPTMDGYLPDRLMFFKVVFVVSMLQRDLAPLPPSRFSEISCKRISNVHCRYCVSTCISRT